MTIAELLRLSRLFQVQTTMTHDQFLALLESIRQMRDGLRYYVVEINDCNDRCEFRITKRALNHDEGVVKGVATANPSDNGVTIIGRTEPSFSTVLWFFVGSPILLLMLFIVRGMAIHSGMSVVISVVLIIGIIMCLSAPWTHSAEMRRYFLGLWDSEL